MLVKSKTTWTEVFPSLFDSGSLRRITKSSLYVCCAHWYSPQSSLKPQLLKQLQQLKPSFLGELIFHTQLLLFIPKSSRPMRDHSHNSASKWNIYMWLYIFLCPSVIFAHCCYHHVQHWHMYVKPAVACWKLHHKKIWQLQSKNKMNLKRYHR